MSVKKTREDLGAALKKALPKFDVFPGSVGDPTKPTLDFERTGYAPSKQAPNASIQQDYVLYVIAPMGGTSDELADWVEDVTEVLDSITGTWWDDVRRGIYGANPDGSGGLQCYLITLHTLSNRTN